MRYLEDWELKRAKRYMEYTAEEVAPGSLCLSAKCGATIINGDIVVGQGFNAPPQNDLSLRKCLDDRRPPREGYRHDLTCCVHAEIRAGIDALGGQWSHLLPGSTLFFTRIDERGQIIKSGDPYCTLCSRFVLDIRVSHFALWHESGIAVYDTVEFNNLSFSYKGP